MSNFPVGFWSFNPRQLSNLVLWLDAADPVGNGILPANNSSVATWVDKSGKGANATQPTSASQPTFLTNQQNTRPAIRTNGNTSGIGITVPSLTVGSNISVFLVGNISGLIMELSQDAGVNSGFWFDTTENVSLRNGSVLTAGTFGAWSTGQFQLANFSYDGSNLNLHVKKNGTSQTIYTTSGTIGNTPTTTGLYIGGRSTTYTYGNLSYICEIIICNSPLSASAIAATEKYLYGKWGL